MCKYYIGTDYANPYIVDGFYNILDFYQTQVQPYTLLPVVQKKRRLLEG